MTVDYLQFVDVNREKYIIFVLILDMLIIRGHAIFVNIKKN